MPSHSFVPSPEQAHLLDYMHANPDWNSIVGLCKRAGIARATYYRWADDPEFRLWFAAAWASRLLLDGAVMLNIARYNAASKFSYWKVLFDLIFDPKGLSLLAKWQKSLTDSAPDTYPDNSSVSPDSQPNQSLSPQNETDPADFRALTRHFRALTRTAPKAGAPGTRQVARYCKNKRRAALSDGPPHGERVELRLRT